MVRIKPWICCNVDLDDVALPKGPVRIVRIYTKGKYKEPWIELEGVRGQFRAKELELA